MLYISKNYVFFLMLALTNNLQDSIMLTVVNKNIKGEKNMKIRLNENEKVVKMVKEGLKKKNGYCPCRLEMNEDTKCMCKEFREQIADENFEGYCHCMLYYKEK